MKKLLENTVTLDLFLRENEFITVTRKSIRTSWYLSLLVRVFSRVYLLAFEGVGNVEQRIKEESMKQQD